MLRTQTGITLKREPLPDATPNMADIRGMQFLKGIYLTFTVFNELLKINMELFLTLVKIIQRIPPKFHF